MRKLSIALFALVGLINVFPLIGVFGPEHLQTLYGVALVDADELLLMRHRAVLLGLVGGLLLVAAWRPKLRVTASVLGFSSMVSFSVLALPLHQHGAALQQVFWADVVATTLLAVALWASRSEFSRDR